MKFKYMMPQRLFFVVLTQCWLLIALTLFYTPSAVAHKLAPALLELTELDNGYFQVLWQQPRSIPRGQKRPEIGLPEHCGIKGTPEGKLIATATGPAVSVNYEIDCSDKGIYGESISVQPLSTGMMALVRINFLEAKPIVRLLSPYDSTMQVPASGNLWQTLGEYIGLGIEHILSGLDHLLFIAGLLLLVRKLALLVGVITAFTVGHSISLTSIALWDQAIPTDLVEIAIALSIFWLALALSTKASNPSILHKYPWSMTSLFGLLHGMGFANVLREIGLPPQNSLSALLSFNIGVELGQLFFIAIAVSLGYALSRTVPMWLNAGRLSLIYIMGGVSVYWCLSRSASLLFT